MTNNELSRNVLSLLKEQAEAVKFQDLVKAIGLDARTVYKNLFYLEEHKYVQLSTSYPSEAVYPLIHLVRLRQAGKKLVENPEKLEEVFPLSDTSRDHAPHIPPGSVNLTYQQVLSSLAEDTERAAMGEDERRRWLARIEEMKDHPLATERIKVLESG